MAKAAADGNEVAREVLAHACEALAGASLKPSRSWRPRSSSSAAASRRSARPSSSPLRKQVEHYVFPPLADAYQLVPAQLGEAVVVHGALALAASAIR